MAISFLFVWKYSMWTWIEIKFSIQKKTYGHKIILFKYPFMIFIWFVVTIFWFKLRRNSIQTFWTLKIEIIFLLTEAAIPYSGPAPQENVNWNRAVLANASTKTEK